MKYFIGYYNDDCSRESCNVFYSNLIIAPDEKTAFDKYLTYQGISSTDTESISLRGIIEVEPI